MQLYNYRKAALLTLLLVATFIAVWELYWRGLGFAISYNDDEPLWANKRKEIY